MFTMSFSKLGDLIIQRNVYALYVHVYVMYVMYVYIVCVCVCVHVCALSQ